MPQLDFTWWMINFMLIWSILTIVLMIIITNSSSQKMTQLSTTPKVKKNNKEWQWL